MHSVNRRRLAMYSVKTRNFQCRPIVKRLLDVSKRFGVGRVSSYPDGDGEMHSREVRGWRYQLFFRPMYSVKTRNWRCNRFVKRLLDFTLQFGVRRGDDYSDGDAKYLLDTRSPGRAWGIWVYFMMLRPWSGGWTYICRPGRMSDCHYRHIY